MSDNDHELWMALVLLAHSDGGTTGTPDRTQRVLRRAIRMDGIRKHDICYSAITAPKIAVTRKGINKMAEKRAMIKGYVVAQLTRVSRMTPTSTHANENN